MGEKTQQTTESGKEPQPLVHDEVTGHYIVQTQPTNVGKQWSLLNNEATTPLHSRQWGSKYRLSTQSGKCIHRPTIGETKENQPPHTKSWILLTPLCVRNEQPTMERVGRTDRASQTARGNHY